MFHSFPWNKLINLEFILECFSLKLAIRNTVYSSCSPRSTMNKLLWCLQMLLM